MFHLFSHCWSWLQAIQEPIRKVTLLVMGLDNAGKTSVIADMGTAAVPGESAGHGRARAALQWGCGCGRRGTRHRDAPGPLCQLSALSPPAALAGEVLPDAQPGRSRLRLDRFEVTLVDLPGGQRSRSAWRSHYSEAHGLLFVLDSGDPARVEEARKVLSRVLSHPEVSGKPLLLHRPSPGEDAQEGAGKSGEPRPVRPVCRLLPPEESTQGPRRRKRKVKAKKKGSGQPSPAGELDGPGIGAAGGLLLPNRVGQEEPIPTSHPDLYRRAMLALKMRQEQGKQPSAIAP
ncbi:hypothetical protein DV515_00007256 [Chloebia gouldiae]|uniref:AR13B protein n=1 Tax=Chloebia gouldiae TaxID=44316 RepID=A0A3L8SJV2_CHLGU|nr:hypothetical protein DV515_00007256 [Chloebia gouldiae]